MDPSILVDYLGILFVVAFAAYVYLAYQFRRLSRLLNISIAKKEELQKALAESLEKETRLQESLDQALLNRASLMQCVSNAATPDQKIQCLMDWLGDHDNVRKP